MTDLKSLDPETRCFALVGQFLHAWSTMELCLHDAIGDAVRVRPLMRFILCANLQIRNKLNILNSIVDVSSLKDTERKHYSNLLNDLSQYSAARNMMAHDPFAPDETESDPAKQGVTFGPVKAKGKFSLPPTTWNQDKFREEIEKVAEYADALIRLRDKLRTTKFDHKRATRLVTILSRMPNDSTLCIS